MILTVELFQELAITLREVTHADKAVNCLRQAREPARGSTASILVLLCEFNHFVLQLEVIVVGQVTLNDLHQAWLLVLLVGFAEDLAVLVIAKISLEGHLEDLVILFFAGAN